MTKFRFKIDAIKRYYINGSQPLMSPWHRFCVEAEKANGKINMEGALSDWTIEFEDEIDAFAFRLKFGL